MSLYKQKGSAIWWTDLHHAGQRVRRSTGETDRAAAKKREAELQVELLTAVPNVRGATWGRAVTAWLEAEPRSDSELFSLAKFGRVYPDRALSDVTRDSVDKALSFCKTASTYTRYRTMIAAILNLAHRAGQLPNPPLLATRKDKKTKPREWLTPVQWAKLYAELPPHMKPMALFAVETGLRQANVLGLRWERVDIERGLVWIEAEDTKEDKAISVPLNQVALSVVKERRSAPRYKSKSGRTPNGEETFVFTFRGAPVSEIKTAFKVACIRAGVPGFTWHGLRHTWATWHVQNGTPLDVLQKLGAWSDPRMVQTYAHHSPGYLAGFAGNNRRST